MPGFHPFLHSAPHLGHEDQDHALSQVFAVSRQAWGPGDFMEQNYCTRSGLLASRLSLCERELKFYLDLSTVILGFLSHLVKLNPKRYTIQFFLQLGELLHYLSQKLFFSSEVEGFCFLTCRKELYQPKERLECHILTASQ